MAAALVALTACKPKLTDEQIIRGFIDFEGTSTDAYQQAVTDVLADIDLPQAQKEAKLRAMQEETLDKILKEGRSILAKNYTNPVVAPEIFYEIYSYLDDDELAKIIDKFSDEVKRNELIAPLVQDVEARKATAVGNKFVDFTVDHVTGTDADGNPIYEKRSLSDYVGKGKVVLVDFWSPWCPPCKEEIPNIKAVWEKYHGADFDVLSVAVWEESRKMDWHDTIDTAAVYGMNWQLLNNGHSRPAALYGIDGIPHMILFDKDGTILKRGSDLRGFKTAQAVALVLGR